MSTWLDLSGAFTGALPEQIAELTSMLGDTGVEVEGTGQFSFNGECSYERYDKVRAICQKFGLEHKLAGYMDSKQDDWGEYSHDYFGTTDQQQRLMYWHLKILLDEAQKNFDAHAGACEEKNIARWVLEKGVI